MPQAAPEDLICYLCGRPVFYMDIEDHHGACRRDYDRALDYYSLNPLCGLLARSVAPPLPVWNEARNGAEILEWCAQYRTAALQVFEQATAVCRGCDQSFPQSTIGAHFDVCPRESKGRVPGCPLVIRLSPLRPHERS
jgi:hypothetical protein